MNKTKLTILHDQAVEALQAAYGAKDAPNGKRLCSTARINNAYEILRACQEKGDVKGVNVVELAISELIKSFTLDIARASLALAQYRDYAGRNARNVFDDVGDCDCELCRDAPHWGSAI